MFAAIQVENRKKIDLSGWQMSGATRMCDAASVVRSDLRTSGGTSPESMVFAVRVVCVVLERQRREKIVVLLDLHLFTSHLTDGGRYEPKAVRPARAYTTCLILKNLMKF